MFRRIIVGIDGREGGADAFALARVMAAPDAEIVLVHAYPFDTPYGWPGEALDSAPAARAAAEEKVARIAPDEPHLERLIVGDMSPGRALHRVAQERDADLIAVGSSHRGRIGRLLAGDVSRATLHGSPCAVAVAPRPYEHTGRPEVIGVGYDGNAQAGTALLLAAALAAEFQAGLRVLTAAAAPPHLHPGYAHSFDLTDERERRRVMIEQTVERAIAALTVPVETEIVDAPAGKALEALSAHVGLLVTGSRGWGAAHRVVLGSTSDHLTRTAACPLLVIPGTTESEVEHPPARPAGVA